MDPAQYNITIYQGATWQRDMTLKDDHGVVQDLSGYTARMQIRGNYDSTATILSLSNAASGGITLAATAPNISVEITSVQTAAMRTPQAVYDVEIEAPSGRVDRILFGTVSLNKDVTR